MLKHNRDVQSYRLTLGVALLAVEAALEDVLARALGTDRVVQALDIGGNLASQSRGSRKGSEQESIEAAHLDGVAVVELC